MRVLSTKKLNQSQKELLLGADISLVEYDAIQITPLEFEVPPEIENAVFTSKNGVRTFFSGQQRQVKIENVFCVGEKTASLLNEFGLNVIKIAQNSFELGQFLVKNHQNERFWYICGSRRRDELVDLLNSAKMTVFELKTYKTDLNYKKIDGFLDGILFFSPSGVQSYLKNNQPGEALAFCIGDTTAKEAEKGFNAVWTANSATVESVIAKAVKILKTNAKERTIS